MATGETLAGWPRARRRADGRRLRLGRPGDAAEHGSTCRWPATATGRTRAAFVADGRLVAVDVVRRLGSSRRSTSWKGRTTWAGIWGYAGRHDRPGRRATSGRRPRNGCVFDPECGGCIVETAGYAEAVLELDADLNVVSLEPARGRREPRGQRLRRGAAALPARRAARRLAAAHAKNGRVYVWSRERSRRRATLERPRRPERHRRVVPVPAELLARSRTCSSSPPRATTTTKGRRGRSTRSSHSRSARAARFPARPTWTAPGDRARPEVAAADRRRPRVRPRRLRPERVRARRDDGRGAVDRRAARSAALAPIAYAGDEVLDRRHGGQPPCVRAPAARRRRQARALRRSSYATAAASASSRGSRRDTTWDTPSRPIVTP